MKENHSEKKTGSRAAANQVAQRKSQGKSLPSSGTGIVQKSAPEEEMQLKKDVVQKSGNEDEEMQKKSLPVQKQEAAPQNNTGMPGHIKSNLEGISGMDMSDVRVNYNSEKPGQLNALAYARGNDIQI